MELITKAVLVHSLIDVEIFSIKVNYHNYQIIRKRLEMELAKIINILNVMKDEGDIGSVSKPRNKKLQVHLNRLIDVKKILKQSISNISEVYYK